MDAAPALFPATACDEPCDGQVDIVRARGQSDRPEGGTLEITQWLENCGEGTAPAGVRLVLRGRDRSGIIEVLDEAATSLDIPSQMAEIVRVSAPWERWSRYFNRQDRCLETVIETGHIEDCSVTGTVQNDQMEVDGCCHCIDDE